ncbi:hypothetical protein ACIBG6_04770 [Streptomyces sp. NPDC050842]
MREVGFDLAEGGTGPVIDITDAHGERLYKEVICAPSSPTS